jgi:hypothetical protein
MQFELPGPLEPRLQTWLPLPVKKPEALPSVAQRYNCRSKRPWVIGLVSWYSLDLGQLLWLPASLPWRLLGMRQEFLRPFHVA